MSSLVIGLDINESFVTAALVRIDRPGNAKRFSIERDTYFTRSLEYHTGSEPREVIRIWIHCINDLLLDFVENHQADETIDGIAIGMPGPMDYSTGTSFLQSSVFQKFFGLNLRLAVEYELKQLILRWKKEFFSSAKPNRHRRQPPGKASRRMTLTPSSTPSIPITFNIPLKTIDSPPEKDSPKEQLSHFCGFQDDTQETLDSENDVRLFIPRSRRDTYFHDIELNSPSKSSPTSQLTPQLWPIIEQLSAVPITFYNDAISFALGELTNDYNQGYKRILVLTLGISFSSAFLDQGQLIRHRDDVPPDGTLCNCPYDQHTVADDWFSIRGLINLYRKLRRHESPDDSSGTSSMTLSTDDIQQDEENGSMTLSSLTRRAANGDANAVRTFQTFARLLGQFLIPYIDAFQTELILIGGNLAQVWFLFEDELNFTIKKFSKAHVYFSLSQAKSISLGAVQQHAAEQRAKNVRQTDQPLLPVVKTAQPSQYDLYPCQQIPIGSIEIGHRTLNEKLFRLLEENQMLLIDGFVGASFPEYASQFNGFYSEQRKDNPKSPSLLFYDARTYLQTDSNLPREAYLQDPQSTFGRLATNLSFHTDFIDGKKLKLFKSNLSYPCVVIGPGAAYVNETSPLIYMDLPKNELYYRIAAGTSVSYLKPKEKPQQAEENLLSSLFYEQKCLYYLDYPVLSKLKQDILPRIQLFIDSQRPNCPTWIDGDTFRQTLAYLSNQTIRLRPWFESGSWGGQWLKTLSSQLSKHSKNYAWAHEMLPAGNGILLSDRRGHLLEFSWDLFYGSQCEHVLGNAEHIRFFAGEHPFPLRLNLLDSIDGENLPLQCQPSLDYIRRYFGEQITQDVTYYILQTKQRWQEEYQNEKLSSSFLYLGFQEKLDPKEFHRAFALSQQDRQDPQVDKYIQRLPTDTHEFYLIPNETIHAAGRNQVILEISSAPYIYTFKLYDWLRSGLNGRPRHLDIEHGMKNLKFNRPAEELRCQPKTIHQEANEYEEQHLATHDLHFYDVHRLLIEANEKIAIDRSTENRFHLCILVQGDAIEIEYNSLDHHEDKQIRQYNYLESFLIPASIQQYRVRPIVRHSETANASRKSILLITFLKWDCEKILE